MHGHSYAAHRVHVHPQLSSGLQQSKRRCCRTTSAATPSSSSSSSSSRHPTKTNRALHVEQQRSRTGSSNQLPTQRSRSQSRSDNSAQDSGLTPARDDHTNSRRAQQGHAAHSVQHRASPPRLRPVPSDAAKLQPKHTTNATASSNTSRPPRSTTSSARQQLTSHGLQGSSARTAMASDDVHNGEVGSSSSSSIQHRQPSSNMQGCCNAPDTGTWAHAAWQAVLVLKQACEQHAIDYWLRGTAAALVQGVAVTDWAAPRQQQIQQQLWPWDAGGPQLSRVKQLPGPQILQLSVQFDALPTLLALLQDKGLDVSPVMTVPGCSLFLCDVPVTCMGSPSQRSQQQSLQYSGTMRVVITAEQGTVVASEPHRLLTSVTVPAEHHTLGSVTNSTGGHSKREEVWVESLWAVRMAAEVASKAGWQLGRESSQVEGTANLSGKDSPVACAKLAAAITARLDQLQQQLSARNSAAWADEDTYSAWLQRFGTPQEFAAWIKKDPYARLGSTLMRALQSQPRGGRQGAPNVPSQSAGSVASTSTMKISAAHSAHQANQSDRHSTGAKDRNSSKDHATGTASTSAIKDPETATNSSNKGFGTVNHSRTTNSSYAPLHGLRITNLMGSHGLKALAMACLGAHRVTVVDVSPGNARYAQEAALSAHVPLRYIVADVLWLREVEPIPPAHVDGMDNSHTTQQDGIQSSQILQHNGINGSQVSWRDAREILMPQGSGHELNDHTGRRQSPQPDVRHGDMEQQQSGHGDMDGDMHGDMVQLWGLQDCVVMENGILHYFMDLQPLLHVVYDLLCPGGRLVLRDFHPISTKLIKLKPGSKQLKVSGSYFDAQLQPSDAAFTKHQSQDGSSAAGVLLRRWTLGEIVTAVATAGLVVISLDEEPGPRAADRVVPKTFTLVASKPL